LEEDLSTGRDKRRHRLVESRHDEEGRARWALEEVTRSALGESQWTPCWNNAMASPAPDAVPPALLVLLLAAEQSGKSPTAARHSRVVAETVMDRLVLSPESGDRGAVLTVETQSLDALGCVIWKLVCATRVPPLDSANHVSLDGLRAAPLLRAWALRLAGPEARVALGADTL
jgi:hypothetical protein